MEFYIISHKGAEEATRKELELFSINGESLGEGIILFKSDLKKALQMLHYAKTPLRMGILWGISNNIDKILTKDNLPDYIEHIISNPNIKTFKITGSHNIDQINKIHKFITSLKPMKVDLTDPQIELFLYNSSYTLLGISLDGFELSKRSYKLFNVGRDLKASLAASSLFLVNVHNINSILDPFCGAGTIIIEASTIFYGEKVDRPIDYIYERLNIEEENIENSLNTYNKDNTPQKLFAYDVIPAHVDISRKNAKIIGMDSYINFGRIDPEFISLKIDNIDAIITHGPSYRTLTELEKYFSMLKEEAHIINKAFVFISINKQESNIFKSHFQDIFSTIKTYPVISGKKVFEIHIAGR